MIICLYINTISSIIIIIISSSIIIHIIIIMMMMMVDFSHRPQFFIMVDLANW